MRQTFRLGVIGTMVCDVIHAAPPSTEFSEGWGGVTYALCGLDAALSVDWQIVPLIKVGADVSADARAWVAELTRISPDHQLVEVPELNNRSELRYVSKHERAERMSGGVPAWEWNELRPTLDAARLDALYVNFLSGWEVSLSTMQQLRTWFDGPIYVDLHMMLWQTAGDGTRTLRGLDDAHAWYACCDFIQVNEDEMRTLANSPESLAQEALRAGSLGTFVTRGALGVSYHVAEGFHALADRDAIRRSRSSEAPRIKSGEQLPSALDAYTHIDPTGCGDVWGGTMFSRLLAGDALVVALTHANRAAGVNAISDGVEGLVERIRFARAL